METTTEEKFSEERTEKAIAEFKPNPAFAAASAMIPKNHKDLIEIATTFCKSAMVPKDMQNNPAAVAVAIMFGLELGLSPSQALQNIMVVNGRPSIWGDALKALIVGSGKCEVFDEDPPHKALAQGFGRCRVKRVDGPEPRELEIQFSLDEAKKAGLWGKQGPWQNYPGRMLMYRARSWACRDKFPDILKGMQMREELDDYQIIDARPEIKMPERSQIVQATQVSETGSNAQPAQSAAQPIESQEVDPNQKISAAQRKQLFADLNAAKIDLPKFKLYLKEIGIGSTADITVGQLDGITAWMLKNQKKG
jgi:hypothetical protein